MDLEEAIEQFIPVRVYNGAQIDELLAGSGSDLLWKDDLCRHKCCQCARVKRIMLQRNLRHRRQELTKKVSLNVKMKEQDKVGLLLKRNSSLKRSHRRSLEANKKLKA